MLLAHLDRRTGRRVLCSACGGQIAHIADAAEKPILSVDTLQGAPIRYARYPDPSIAGPHYLLFGPGWWPCRRDGVYRLTRHAARQRELGYNMGMRRAPLPVRGRWRDAEVTPPSLPVRAECSVCKAINVLDAEPLRVAVVKAGQYSRGLRVPG